MCVWTSRSFVTPGIFGLAVFWKVAFISLVVPLEGRCSFIVSHFAMDTCFMVLFLHSMNAGCRASPSSNMSSTCGGGLHAPHQPPTAACGQNVIFQIHESLFRHKPNYHRGRPQAWNSGWDISTSPPIGNIELVADQRATTLPPIIQCVVRPSSTATSGPHTASCTTTQTPPAQL